MKKLTISDLATILQLDITLKDNLNKNFDSFDENTKDKILKSLWDGIYELETRLAKLKYEQLLREVDEGKRQLTTNLYQEAVKAVWNDFEDILSGKKIEIKQIEEIRADLQLPTTSSPPPQK